jgi:prepilin-type processing-associated H-X9-DG protein
MVLSYEGDGYDPDRSWAQILGGELPYNVKGPKYLPYNSTKKRGTVWHCPLADVELGWPRGNWYWNYGMNGMWNVVHILWNLDNPTGNLAGKKIDRLSPQLVLLGDGNCQSPYADPPASTWYFGGYTIDPDFGPSRTEHQAPWPLNTAKSLCSLPKNHGGAVNIAFVDGHVEAILSSNQLCSLNWTNKW